MLGVSLHRGQERPLHESVKVKPGLPWRPQDVRDARALGYLLKKAANTGPNHPKKNSVLHSASMKGVGDLKSVLTSYMKMQSLESVQLVFSLPWPSISSLHPLYTLWEW